MAIFRITGTTSNGTFNTSGTGQAIIGELQKVVISTTSWANGSIFITDVNTKEAILTEISASGANPKVIYPRVFVEDTASAALSGTNAQSWDKIFLNGPILVSGLGLGSTAAGTVGTIDIYYC